MPGRFIVRTSGPPVREEKNCLYTIAIYNTFLKKGLLKKSPKKGIRPLSLKELDGLIPF